MNTQKTSTRLFISLFVLLGCSFIASNSAQAVRLSDSEQLAPKERLELESRESLKIAKQTVDQERANVAYILMVSEDSSQAAPTVTFCKEFSLPSLNSTGKSEIGFEDKNAKATLKGTCENKDGGRLFSFEFSLERHKQMIVNEGEPAINLVSRQSVNTSITLVPGEIKVLGGLSRFSTNPDPGKTEDKISYIILYCP
jgi:hypothetical protein